MMKFEIRDSNNDEFYFRVVASNGKILSHSQTYNNYDDCYHAVKLIIEQASDAEIYDERKNSRNLLRKNSIFLR